MRLVSVFILSLILISCGTAGPAAKTETRAVAEIMDFHQAAMPDFQTMVARIQASYETEDKEQRITLTLRMKKDEIIWVKASILGITIAKALITPDEVQYYETIGKTYFEGDFSILGEWIGIPINFEQAQALLLGQSIFEINPQPYQVEIIQDSYRIQPRKQPENFIHSLVLSSKNFRIVSETLSQPLFERTFNVRYGDYQTVSGQYFPTLISIRTNEAFEQTKIDIDYRKIDLNPEVGFPFQIPSNYHRIEL